MRGHKHQSLIHILYGGRAWYINMMNLTLYSGSCSYSHTKLLTKFDLCLYHVFPKQDQKQFAYLGPGVGVLAQPPGDVVEGGVEAAGVVALPAERSSRRR